MVNIPEETREAFRRYGLVAPEKVPPAGVSKFKRVFDSILTVYFRRGDETGGWVEDERRELGRIVHENFSGDFDTCLTKIGHFLAVIAHNFKLNDEIRTLFMTPASMVYLAQLGAWYDAGFPKVIVDATFAASLMSTSLTKEVATSVIPPWPAFFVELPESVLQYTTKRGISYPVDHLFVFSFGPKENLTWAISVYAGLWEMWAIPHASTADLVARDEAQEDRILDVGLKAITDQKSIEENLQHAHLTGLNPEEVHRVFQSNARLGGLAQRLVAGICLAMSDPANIRQLKPKLKMSLKPKSQRGVPLTRTFVLGRPVAVDCRGPVRAYAEGREGSVPKVQVLVRGHWKMQAHGKGLALRKPIHVEPYWRGPEEAPIPIRPHVVTG